jgi:CheY-like chemotaxis protein
MGEKTFFRDNKHLLVVDNEFPILIMLKEILQQHGYQVTIKKNSTEAFKLFLKQPERFDLVITDFNMPEMSGDILANKLLQIRPEIPIILCTGNRSIISQERACKSDFKDLLLKPFTIKDITHSIHKILNNNQILH